MKVTAKVLTIWTDEKETKGQQTNNLVLLLWPKKSAFRWFTHSSSQPSSVDHNLSPSFRKVAEPCFFHYNFWPHLQSENKWSVTTYLVNLFSRQSLLDHFGKSLFSTYAVIKQLPRSQWFIFTCSQVRDEVVIHLLIWESQTLHQQGLSTSQSHKK